MSCEHSLAARPRCEPPPRTSTRADQQGMSVARWRCAAGRYLQRTLVLFFLVLALGNCRSDPNRAQHELEQKAASAFAVKLRAVLADSMAKLARGDSAAMQAAAQVAAPRRSSMPASLFPPAQDIFMAAVASTKEGGQPVAFRRACVELGLVTQLVQLLARANEPSLQPARRSALAALAAIATDDPTSDVDNDHALAVCSAGVVPYVVDALSAPDREVQLSGAGCMAVLAEEPRCTKLLLNEGAVPHLLSLASYGPSHGVRATALAAIEQLSHDPDARETLIHLGTLLPVFSGYVAPLLWIPDAHLYPGTVLRCCIPSYPREHV
eukprot:5039037-Pleurochrysis_carterae.AAC.2